MFAFFAAMISGCLLLRPALAQCPGDLGWANAPAESTSSIHVGQYSSVVYPSAGWPLVAYYDADNGNLKFGWGDGNGWHTTTVDSSASEVGKYNDIAIDSDEDAHISFYDSSAENLKYVWQDGGTWQTAVTLQSSGLVGKYTSIDVDSENEVYISYVDLYYDEIRVIRTDGGTWQSAVTVGDFSEGTGHGPDTTSIRVDSQDRIHVAFVDHTDGDVMYAISSNHGASFSTPVDTNEGACNPMSPSLDVDSNDYPHIAFHACTCGWPPTYEDLNVVYYDGTWHSEAPDAPSGATSIVGVHPGLAIDWCDGRHIGYLRKDSTWPFYGALRYVVDHGTGWSSPETAFGLIDPLSPESTASIAVDQCRYIVMTCFEASVTGSTSWLYLVACPIPPNSPCPNCDAYP